MEFNVDYSSLAITIFSIASAMLVYLLPKQSDLNDKIVKVQIRIDDYRKYVVNILVRQSGGVPVTVNWTRIRRKYNELNDLLNDCQASVLRLANLIMLTFVIIIISGIVTATDIISNQFETDGMDYYSMIILLSTIICLIAMHGILVMYEKHGNN